ncbi:DUF4411 family protein [Lentzea sp. NPDC004789]
MTEQPIYVIDSHALIELQRVPCLPARLNLVFDSMTDMVHASRLNFPAPVVRECKEYAEGEPVHTWVKAISVGRRIIAPDAEYQVVVLDACENIADPDDDEESVPLFVAALALQLRDQNGSEPFVVTEDRRSHPVRASLLEACSALGLQSVTLMQFLDTEGLLDIMAA